METKNTETKNHYRKVFKSDHLGSADLEEFIEEKINLNFTIEKVVQEYDVSVAGKKGNFNIAYFKEQIKPLVLNSTNSKVLKTIAGGSPFVEDWKNIVVELYIDHNVKMKGEVVGGVRLRQGKIQLPFLTETSKAFQNAVTHLKDGGSIDKIKERFQLTEEIIKKLNENVNSK